MNRTALVLCALLSCCIHCLNAQVNSTVVFGYDDDGNRTFVSYIIERIDENDSVQDNRSFNDLENTETQNISVYPNPTNGYLMLSYDSFNDKEAVYVKLYSMQGMVLDERVMTSNCLEFNLLEYPAGIYFLSVSYDDNNYLWKIVKK